LCRTSVSGKINHIKYRGVVQFGIHLEDKLLKEFIYSHDNQIDDYLFYLEKDLSEIIKKKQYR